ncbi:MAG: hypothetical protein KJO24_05705 [Gammaproteobacteria bacterium]|nr:hypothetical protein [Gammaproteobacteria bacterium]
MLGSISSHLNTRVQQALPVLALMAWLLLALQSKNVDASVEIDSNDESPQPATASPAGMSQLNDGDRLKTFFDQVCASREWREYALHMRADESLNRACKNNKASRKKPPAFKHTDKEDYRRD